MSILNFARPRRAAPGSADLSGYLRGYSIEVMPRTAAKVEDFRAILPARTLIYIAHIDGTPIDDMVATAKRLADEGFEVVPHFPARSIPDAAALRDWTARYAGEAGVTRGLVLAGGIPEPRGAFASSIDLLESGILDAAGFRHLDVAGHPEGNRDIDPSGGDANVMAALRWKQDFAERTDAQLAITTQFAFDAAPVAAWDRALRAAGIALPINIGIAGPAKLQTLIKFAVACGVGPSLKVLQKRAMDVSKLVLPYEPTDVVTALARHRADDPASLIGRVHIFPLGGISPAATWAAKHLDPQAAAQLATQGH